MNTAGRPSDWKVVYGDHRQFVAYFGDQARAEAYAASHGGVLRPLFEQQAPPCAHCGACCCARPERSSG